MGISAYSVIISVLFYNLSLIVVFLLSRSGAIRAKHMSALLLFFTFLSAVRLLTPVDLDNAFIIRSYKFLPMIEDGLTAKLIGPFSLGGLLLLIWVAGVAVCVLVDCVKFRRGQLAGEQLKLTPNESVSRIAKEFGESFILRISPEVDLPYVTGLFRPVIYLPDADLSDAEWRNILRHETQHIKARDEWKKLFFRVIRAAFWWNPLVHLSENDISLLFELQCDERAAGKGNPDEQESYLRTMVALMKRYTYGDTPVGASRMIGKQEEMKTRFKALLAQETKYNKQIRAAISALMVALFVASYLVVVQPARFPNEKEIYSIQTGHTAYGLPQEIDSSREQFIIIENGEYKLYIDGQFTMAIDENLLSDPSFREIPIIGG